MATSTSTSLSSSKPSNIFVDFQNNFQNLFKTAPSSKGSKASTLAVDMTIYDQEIEDAQTFLTTASVDKTQDPNEVIEALESLEKLMRKRNKLDEGLTSIKTLDQLNGSWRLIFTTGTADTQKKFGKVNYFPIKAVQSFDTSTTPFSISNGIFLGDFSVVKFFGDFEWKEKARKLEFDFDRIAVLGLGPFDLPKGGAAKIGSSTGLGSESNEDLIKNQNKKPFFNWISADPNIATARGGGGGLALWKRIVEEE